MQDQTNQASQYKITVYLPYCGSLWSIDVQQGTVLVKLPLVEQVALWGLGG